jgi:N-formylglutamate deformylase
LHIPQLIEGRDQMASDNAAQIAVLHIPHSSRCVPVEERQTILLDDVALNRELLCMTDSYTDELFSSPPVEAARLVFPVSRLVCDVERFPSDEDEPMARRGMGAIYARTSKGETLRVQPDAVHRQTLLDRWYWPHHVELEGMVNHVAARSGVCLIVDCHSFASVALPYELDQTSDRADICIVRTHSIRLRRSAMRSLPRLKRRVIRSLSTFRSPVRWSRFHLTKRISAFYL